MKIKHVFFDLDHTLYDFEENSAQSYKKVFKDMDITLDVYKFLNYYKIINQRYWKLYREEKISRESLRHGRLKDTFEFLKCKASENMINLIADEYLKELPNHNKLFVGTHELLSYLKPKYQLHIITNGFSKVQKAKLKNSGIEKYFNKIITSELVGVKKPNPKVFKYSVDFANAQINESMMIGDNWEADIMGAKNVGMSVIYCNFDNMPVGESVTSVTNLLEIKEYL